VTSGFTLVAFTVHGNLRSQRVTETIGMIHNLAEISTTQSSLLGTVCAAIFYILTTTNPVKWFHSEKF